METIKTIIDTDLLIDLLRNKKEAVIFITKTGKRPLHFMYNRNQYF